MKNASNASRAQARHKSGATKVRRPVLIGCFDRKVDASGKFVMPKDWMVQLGSPRCIFVMPDRKEKCLTLIPEAEMEKTLKSIRARNLEPAGLVRSLAVVGSMSAQLVIDARHRISVGRRFLDFAGIGSKVMMIGSIRVIKLWGEASFREFVEDPDGEIGALLDSCQM